MPLTAKGETLLSKLEKEYGAKKGKEVLYAGKNKGTFTGIDAIADAVMGVCDSVGKLHARIDAYCARRDDHRVFGGVGFKIADEEERLWIIRGTSKSGNSFELKVRASDHAEAKRKGENRTPGGRITDVVLV